MQVAARSYVTAATALATGSIIAGTPLVTPSLPDVQVPAIQFTADSGTGVDLSPLQQLDAGQIASNGQLVSGELIFNQDLVTNEVQFEEMLFGSDSALNGVVNRLFNINNMFLDFSENSLNSLVGANFDAGAIHASLLAGLNPDFAFEPNVFDSGNTGGLLGAYDQGLIATGDITGMPALAALAALDAAQAAFNTTLVAVELDFNQLLVANEVAAEEQVFGTDSALNGVVNRLFNVDNMVLDSDENSLNSLLGANFDAGAIHASLLTGLNPDITFNSGDIGGLTGVFDQNLSALADIAGMSPADWTTLFGLTPTDYTELLGAANVSDFFTDTLPILDWFSLFLNPFS